MIEPPFILVLLLLVLAGVMVAVVAGAILATAALLTGLHAGVRIRIGLEPTAVLPTLHGFLEKYVLGREAAWGAARSQPATPGERKSSADAPHDPRAPKPQAKL